MTGESDHSGRWFDPNPTLQEIKDVPVPVPGPGELLVKVIACGVCHADLHAASGDRRVKPVPPFIPGHEVAGVVAAHGQE